MVNKKPNLKREIKTLKGELCPMSFPTEADIKKIRDEKDIKDVKFDDLPRETVQNVLINALANYEPSDRKEVFMINEVASWVMADDEERGELKDKFFKFLTDEVLEQATIIKSDTVEPKKPGEKAKKSEGLYSAWCIGQVYDELGVTQ